MLNTKWNQMKPVTTRVLWFNEGGQSIRLHWRWTIPLTIKKMPSFAILTVLNCLLDPSQQIQGENYDGMSCDDSCFSECLTDEVNECVEACQRFCPPF